ncbi:hypothetical protein JCGZ_22156 [Jatropha curcas]|uniref:Uncharacterized protein n=1 Tax=Jatropha curcas TaxID=180498 RepID=A0A067LJU9_JATCU|nr:hypothetical protein JCGZ_22156 [Jatropha curcas]
MAANRYQDDQCKVDYDETSWKIAPLEEVKSTCKERNSFEDGLNLTFLFPDMIVNDDEETKVQLEGALGEILNEHKQKAILVDEEIIETIDLSSSLYIH